jgi:leucyl aminopeptidase
VFKSIRVGKVASPLIVAGVFGEGSKLPRHLSKLDKEAGGTISESLRRPGFKAEAGEITPANNSVLIVGLGKESDLTPQVLRTVGAKIIRVLDRMSPREVQFILSEAIDGKALGHELAGRAVAEGMALANWRVDQFDGKATKKEPRRDTLTVHAAHKSFRNGMSAGLLLAQCANYARELAATPPNICNPTWIAQQARKLARETGLKCTIIDFKKAQQLGMGGIVNVGKASNHKPCLVILEHSPRKVAAKAKGKTIALVGKTITFDTGGYSLKISGGMKGMKYDKNGGMAVLGAMRAIAAQKTPVNVVGLLPCAENMVSGEAYRPDDIITMYNKVSVEVTNTDAEGRLVLADALAYACEKYKPAAIIDAATLTGGVIVALGKWSAGVWSTDETLFSRLQDAAEATGEKIWRMPLWNEHKDFMRARHADIWNSGPARDGHPIQGAAFLSFFVDANVPWAHVDIAGMSAVESDTDLYVQGPTGYGVRLLAEAVAGFARR